MKVLNADRPTGSQDRRLAGQRDGRTPAGRLDGWQARKVPAYKSDSPAVCHASMLAVH
jgi:hypothetical protein